MLLKRRIALAVAISVPLALVVLFITKTRQKQREELRKDQEVLAYLTPNGAQLLSQREQLDACWRHIIRKLRADRPAIEVWAERLGLQCVEPEAIAAVDGQPAPPSRTSCTQWRGKNPPVVADISHGYLRVDSTHDYLCGGPFR